MFGSDVGRGDRVGLDAIRTVVDDCARTLGVPVSLDVLCRAAVTHLSATAASVTVPAATIGAQTIAAFGKLARTGEELQVTVGQGPSLEVLAGAGALIAEDLTAPGLTARWPLFAPTATQAGIGSMCVLPMRIGAARFGVLVIYSDRMGSVNPDELAAALLFSVIGLNLLLDHLVATHPGDGLGAVPDRPGAGTETNPARQEPFFDDRPEIHQATGMIAVQLGVDLPTALLRLRARAFTDNRLLSELSADVVGRRVRFNEGGLDGDGTYALNDLR